MFRCVAMKTQLQPTLMYSQSASPTCSQLLLIYKIILKRTPFNLRNIHGFFKRSILQQRISQEINDNDKQKTIASLLGYQVIKKETCAPNQIQKLVTGEPCLLNVVESIAQLKLFVQLNQFSNLTVKTRNTNNDKKSMQLLKFQKLQYPSLRQKTVDPSKIKTDHALRHQVAKNLTNLRHKEYGKPKKDVKILVLNDYNFKSAVLKYKLLLVMFYAPWCKYCNDMKPMFRRAAKDLPQGLGSLAFCNAEISKKVALEHSVYVFPTLKLFRDGKFLTDYSGPRRSLELIKFMVKHAKDDDADD